jgi:hypothetical protein
MKRLFFLLIPFAGFGQVKISDMTAATSLTGTEIVPIVQTTNKKATIQLIRGWGSIGTTNQLLRVNSGATALEFFTPSFLTSESDPLYSANGVPNTRALTINGTSGRITSSAGSQTLAADRTWTLDLATAGTAGTYRSVTTDAYGRVTSGTNPNTLSGYGITDAWSSVNGATLSGANLITGTSSNTLSFRFNNLNASPPIIGAGINLENTTPATSILNQNSPSLTTSGFGWATGAAESRYGAITQYTSVGSDPLDNFTSVSHIWRATRHLTSYDALTLLAGVSTTSLTLNNTSNSFGILLVGSTTRFQAGNTSTNLLHRATAGHYFADNFGTGGAVISRSLPAQASIDGIDAAVATLSSSAAAISTATQSTGLGYAYRGSYWNGSTNVNRGFVHEVIASTVNNLEARWALSSSVATGSKVEHLSVNQAGNICIGTTAITANTRLDLRGIGSSTDLIQRWADNTNTERLAIQGNGVLIANGTTGTNGQVLTTNSSGVPTWQNPAFGSDPMSTAGDMIIRNGSNVTTRLPIGSNGEFLSISGGIPTWTPISGGGDMLLSGTQTNTGAKTFNDGTLLLRNVANTFNGTFTNINTADRTYTLPDESGEVALALTRKKALVIEAEFYTDTSPYSPSFVGAAISGGTDNVITGEINHPGIIDLRDGTTANGGWNISTAANAFRLAGSEKCVITFQIRNARATANGWMGWRDNNTNAQPVDGAYVYFVGNGTTVTMDARTRSNSTETINGTTWVPTLNTWYTLVIELNTNATQVNYAVFNDAGVSQWAVSNTTNIPTASGRETGFGVQANESTTDAGTAIMYVDYVRMEINRTLVR